MFPPANLIGTFSCIVSTFVMYFKTLLTKFCVAPEYEINALQLSSGLRQFKAVHEEILSWACLAPSDL